MIEVIAAHCDACSGVCSNTIRTARYRTSGENLLGLAMKGDFNAAVKGWPRGGRAKVPRTMAENLATRLQLIVLRGSDQNVIRLTAVMNAAMARSLELRYSPPVFHRACRDTSQGPR